MATEIKVTNLAAELKRSETITPPLPRECSERLQHLLRYPDQLRIALERLLGDGMQVVITKKHHIIVQITSQRKQA